MAGAATLPELSQSILRLRPVPVHTDPGTSPRRSQSDNCEGGTRNRNSRHRPYRSIYGPLQCRVDYRPARCGNGHTVRQCASAYGSDVQHPGPACATRRRPLMPVPGKVTFPSGGHTGAEYQDDAWQRCLHAWRVQALRALPSCRHLLRHRRSASPTSSRACGSRSPLRRLSQHPGLRGACCKPCASHRRNHHSRVLVHRSARVADSAQAAPR